MYVDSIWFNKELQLDDLTKLMPGTMGSYLGMEWVEIGPDFLKIKMPVNEKNKQPYGLLHGGASCALAETAGSVCSHLMVDPGKFICVGIEINANHVRGIKEGFVIATSTPAHIGRSTHVWDIRIKDANEKLICISRLTVAILEKK